MNVQIQIVAFFTPIIISLFATLFYLLSGLKRNQEVGKFLLKISIINLVVLLLGAFYWFGIASDGFAQINGWAIYAGFFVVIEIIIFIVTWLYRKIKNRNI